MSIRTTKSNIDSVGSKTKESERLDSAYSNFAHKFLPLENRTVETKNETGLIKKFPALNKRWTVSFKCVRFYLPTLTNIEEDNETSLSQWKDLLDIFKDDLRWLLKIPHHQFWSIMVFCPEISNTMLSSFLIRAPRFYDEDFNSYQNHDTIGPVYREIYELVFRVYMRLATYKETKEDHISPAVWAALLYDNFLFDIPKIQDLCVLYEGTDNPLLPKLVENVLKNEPRFLANIKVVISLFMEKSKEMTRELESKLQKISIVLDRDLKVFQDFITLQIDSIVSMYKFLKVYPSIALDFHEYPNLVLSLADSYESNVKSWSKVLENLPQLENQVYILRAYLLRLFRTILAGPTVLKVVSSNDPRLDQFFDTLMTCLEEKILIHDYEKAFPFKDDMKNLYSRGIFVDSTRIDYLANAISSCFFACGEVYAVEKLVVDPLYDANFDRQLLGACSLDVTGVELESLISQVKDLLPDLPDSYVEAVLKHYSYKTETTINALLEGSVPPRLEKYKSELYVKSQKTQTVPSILIKEDPVRDELPVRFQSNAETIAFENGPTVFQESFHSGKRNHGFADDAKFLDGDKQQIKSKIFENLESQVSPSKNKPRVVDQENITNSYIDESLLPSFREDVEYDDEYDDTYDEVGVGMTEPDNLLFNPLNRKKNVGDEGHENGTNEWQVEDQKPAKNFENFVEDPAVLRAQYERRREEKMAYNQQRRGNQQQNRGQKDVVGKAKGQGQETDVLHNRRQKTAHNEHNKKKRSDFKRREF